MKKITMDQKSLDDEKVECVKMSYGRADTMPSQPKQKARARSVIPLWTLLFRQVSADNVRDVGEVTGGNASQHLADINKDRQKYAQGSSMCTCAQVFPQYMCNVIQEHPKCRI